MTPAEPRSEVHVNIPGGEAPHPPTKCRMVVKESVYFQSVRDSPTSLETCFSRWLDGTDEESQPYTRKMLVGEQWTPLDHGWVERASMLVVRNEQGKFPYTIPTEEERREEMAKVVVLVTDMDTSKGWIIHPGESFRGTPSDLNLYLRCAKGQARVTIHVVPA